MRIFNILFKLKLFNYYTLFTVLLCFASKLFTNVIIYICNIIKKINYLCFTLVNYIFNIYICKLLDVKLYSTL